MTRQESDYGKVLPYLAHGAHTVDVLHDYVLRDAARDKDIPLRIYMPADGGPYPAILYSHGAGDSNATSPLLLRHWASHGYIVIAPTHLFGERPLMERSILRLREELMRPRTLGPEAWRARTGDLSAIIDSLDAIVADNPALHGRIDTDRIAIAGHSFGGYTVLLLGGATLTATTTGEVFEFADPRPRAVLVISGPGCDGMGLTKQSWRNVTRPLMVMAGSRDPGYVPGCGAMWRTEPYLYAPEGDKYLLYLRGAHHLSYIGPVFDIPLGNPGKRGRLARKVRAVARSIARIAPAIDQIGLFDYSRIASAAFWDAYLKDDAGAKGFLDSNTLEEYSLRNARLKSR